MQWSVPHKLMKLHLCATIGVAKGNGNTTLSHCSISDFLGLPCGRYCNSFPVNNSSFLIDSSDSRGNPLSNFSLTQTIDIHLPPLPTMHSSWSFVQIVFATFVIVLTHYYSVAHNVPLHVTTDSARLYAPTLHVRDYVQCNGLSTRLSPSSASGTRTK